MSKTIDYYNENAADFVSGTIDEEQGLGCKRQGAPVPD